MEIKINIEFAKKYGVDAAIFISRLDSMIFDGICKYKNCYDDKCWVKISIEDFAKKFEFWTPAQIRLIIDKLKQAGVLLTGNFGDDKFDRTVWYTIDYDAAGVGGGCKPLYQIRR